MDWHEYPFQTKDNEVSLLTVRALILLDYPFTMNVPAPITELKESKDKKIREAILNGLIDCRDAPDLGWSNFGGIHIDDCIAWLEKQRDKDKLIQELGEYKVKYTQEVLEKYINSMSNKDDERLRKTAIAFLKDFAEQGYENAVECIDWLEKQGKQKPCMVQWKGDNLKEVIGFVGKDKNFEKWFKSFEEYEKYVHEHNDIFKLFNENGSHYEIPVGAWIVKTPDGYNIASNAVLKQKSADKIEPRFKVGDWVVFSKSKNVYKVEKIENYEYTLRHILGGSLCLSFSNEKLIREWTIQDGKDGDVLAAHECYVVFKEIDGLNIKCHCTYHYLGLNPTFYIDTLQNKDAFLPATKEQRDVLMKAMNDAGYEWDGEKKELKKEKVE